MVELFTDGACRGNPGIGGWGVLLRQDGVEKSYKGAEFETTNNRMELTAAIEALMLLGQGDQAILTTDSQYVKNGINDWMPNWKKRNWRTASNKPVKNIDLWQKLDALVQVRNVRWEWVKGHSGHRENDIADQLANEAIDNLLMGRK